MADIQDGAPPVIPRPRKRHRQNTMLPDRPKKPNTGYTMFLKHFFNTHPPNQALGSSTRELLGRAGAEWRNLPQEQRQQFQELCAGDLERYRGEMEIWTRQREVLKRPASAYGMFLKDFWQRQRDAGTATARVTEMGKRCKIEWDTTAAEVKADYAQRYTAAFQAYRTRMDGIHAGVVNLENLVNGVDDAPEDDGQGGAGGDVDDDDDDQGAQADPN